MLRDKDTLLDIHNAATKILSYAAGLTPEQLMADDMRLSAILFQILVVGEATKRLSRDFRSEHLGIDWSGMAGMRDFVAHQYDGISMELLWEVIQFNLPELLLKLKPLMGSTASD